LDLHLPERIAAEEADVLTKADTFRLITTHDLAEALEVPNPWIPSSGFWTFAKSVETPSVEQALADGLLSAEEVGETLDRRELSDERFEILSRKVGELDERRRKTTRFLTPDERALLDNEIFGKCAESEGHCTVLADYTVKTATGDGLSFEGVIEDDGSCIDLSTPYDLRDQYGHPGEIVDHW